MTVYYVSLRCLSRLRARPSGPSRVPEDPTGAPPDPSRLADEISWKILQKIESLMVRREPMERAEPPAEEKRIPIDDISSILEYIKREGAER